MIRAVIFDLDGLLIDSEPLWQAAEVEVFNKIGVPLAIEMTRQTTGVRVDEVVQYWHARYPWETPGQPTICKQIDNAVIELIRSQDIAKPGVHHAIDVCRSAGLPVAIASSSSLEIINAALQNLGITDDIQAIHSAHSEPLGKPDPAVYLSTAKTLGVPPEQCLAFEDSANGVRAAKAAGMKCIAIPEPHTKADHHIVTADLILPSLSTFTAQTLRRLDQEPQQPK